MNLYYKADTPVVRLYFVRADSSDGDLLVRAADAKEAERLWYEYYEFEPDSGEKPDWVAEVPDLPVRGAIPWNSINPKG